MSEKTAFPVHPKVGAGEDQTYPQSTPRTYRMCPHCHAVDASAIDADRALAEAVDNVKRLGGAIEIRGVRIEPCDLKGETDTTRNVAAFGAQLEAMESELVAARARIAELEAAVIRIARIHVEPQPGSEAWPIVERVPGGWQSGAHHYTDSEVLDVTPIILAHVEEAGR